ncbi:MAG: Endoribonuclease YbeY [Proteobacteria bacterium]|jgi:probable rRNA maturation factor|nr:MAG: Endoribonuclease YbeY [Pseudomonadota bacterium]|tara:strand:+ start:183 stop:716 length:534 start_codon:yes stop_codon:yes gene_type:complete
MSEGPSIIENTLEFENCTIYLSNEYSTELNFDYKNITKKTVKELLNTLKCPKAESFELSMKLSDNDTVQQLNKQYRGKDYPTNVLSFEEDLDDQFADFMDEDEPTYIGDIIFAVPVVLQQAQEQNKPVEEHFAHLVAHSILHVFGFDHIDEHEAQVMEDLEIKILQRLQIANPYIER